MATCPRCHTQHGDDLTQCPTDGATLVPDEVFATIDKPLQPGDMAGEYKITGELGRGSFGDVYKAEHPLIGKVAAVKVLKRQFSSDPEVISRFISEARAVNKIRHRNIIDIFAFGTLPGGRQYFIMELLEGQTFQEYLKECGKMHIEVGLPLLAGVARALDAAHEAGIAHRDLKPENVFLCIEKDGSSFPKLLDFGIAKLLADEFTEHQTRTGAAMGTPLYMSPEQCRAKNVDHRADIYAFGCLIHRVLTGEVLFTGESVMDVLIKHTTETAPAMSSVNGEVPPELDKAVQWMLEKNPDDRPQSVGEGFAALYEAAIQCGFALAPESSGTMSAVRTGQMAAIVSRSPASGNTTTEKSGSDGVKEEAATSLDPESLRSTGAAEQGNRSSTFKGVEASLGSSAGSDLRKGLAIGAVLAVVIGGGYYLTRGEAAPTTEATTEATSATPNRPPAKKAATPPAQTAAPISSTVKLKLSTTPPEVNVFVDDKPVGSSSDALELARGQKDVTIRLEKAGYIDKIVQVRPEKNIEMSLSLDKTPQRPAAGPTKPAVPAPVKPHSDLEGLE